MYPNLTNMLVLLALDNGMTTYQRPVGEWSWPSNAKEMEDIASMMTVEERSEMVAGCETVSDSADDESKESIIDRYKAHAIDKFLDEVFDGSERLNFFYR